MAIHIYVLPSGGTALRNQNLTAGSVKTEYHSFGPLLHRFFKNGLILTLSALAMRIVGVSFNSFITSKVGADGIGLYTLIMSVYGFSVTVASSGVHLASTRLCAEARDRAHLFAALRRCLIWAGSCGLAVAVGLAVGADFISIKLLQDARCAASLRLLGMSMPFIALSNVLSGYFTAVRKVSRNVAAQIFEQLVKIFVSVYLLLYILPDGIEYACIALVGGGMLAEAASFIVSLILFLIDSRVMGRTGRAVNCVDRAIPACRRVTPEEGRELTRELFGIIMPVSAAAYIRSALNTAEHILIPMRLRANPATSANALAALGVLGGMVMPVIMLPTALLYSFTGLLVPEFAEANSRGDNARIRRITERAAHMTLVFSIGCAGVMYLLSDELGILLYDNADAGRLIRVMSALIPVMYLDHAVDAILKGLGEQLYSMKVNILDAAMSVALVYILCGRLGVWGYVLTIYISELVNASLSMVKVWKRVDFRPRLRSWLICPLFCAAAAVAAAGLMPAGVGWISTLLRGIVAVGVYVVLTLILWNRWK